MLWQYSKHENIDYIRLSGVIRWCPGNPKANLGLKLTSPMFFAQATRRCCAHSLQLSKQTKRLWGDRRNEWAGLWRPIRMDNTLRKPSSKKCLAKFQLRNNNTGNTNTHCSAKTPKLQTISSNQPRTHNPCVTKPHQRPTPGRHKLASVEREGPQPI